MLSEQEKQAIKDLKHNFSTITKSQFMTGSASVSPSSSFINNKTTGALSCEVDGTGVTAPVQIAGLSANLALTNQDILVV